LDFYSPEYKIGIEADGGQHYDDKGIQADEIRTRELSEHGIEILRFSNRDILNNINGVYEVRNNPKVNMAGLRYEFLIWSSNDAWFEMNGDGIKQKDEEEGNMVFAVLIAHVEELMKVIVFGDSDFASNADINVGGNTDLYLNVSNWLLGEGGFVQVSAPKSEFIPMFVTVEQARILRIIITIGIPLVIIIAGTVVWYRRRAL